jgi:arylsulfatase A-like enzyme
MGRRRSIASRAIRAVLSALALGPAACLPGEPRRELDLVALFATARSGAETAQIDFGSDASLPALVAGFGPRGRAGGSEFQWGQGERSELRFGVAEPRELEVALRAWPLAFAGAPPQSVAVEANGHPVATLELAPGPSTYRLRIPARALVAGENRLALRYAWARAPREVIPGSREERPFAVGWDWIRFSGARSHGSAAAETPDAAPPALRIPLAAWVDFYLRLPDGSELRAARIEPFGAPREARLEVALEPAGESVEVAEFAPGGALELALPAARGAPMRIALRALGECDGESECGLRLVRPVIETPAPEARAAASPQSAPGAGRPNVVLYLVDTLRADRLGIYGYPRPTSPHVDAFARDATLFRHAFAQSSWTKPAVATLFTGLLPQTHRINARAAAIPEDLPTLPEILRGLGYATFGVVTNGNVSGAFGFARGFDAFEHLREGATREIHQRSDRANELAFALLGRRPPGRPFFLYVHTADPHWPYTPPEAQRAKLAAEVRDPDAGLADLEGPAPGPHLRRAVSQLYDAEIAFNDESFGRLLEKLDELGLAASSLVVLTSDHGEAFAEHGSFRHGATLFSEEIRIPLAIRFPGGLGRGRVVEAPARQVDLLPTILDAVGAPLPPGLQGHSLLPVASAEASPAEPATTFAYLDRRGRVVEAAIEGGHKLIRFRIEGRGPPAIGLFELARDPGETRDLSAWQPIWREYLLARLDAAAAGAPTGREPPTATLDPEQERALAALGYLEE